ncbi:hypothetical protein [Candidatus Allofournierella merdipullorum]|uniref:hypothetical protein n=1 Tax=Candidatus Allofournierella merdipullorum TaxID=2838595 RepID=UPI003AB85EF3
MKRENSRPGFLMWALAALALAAAAARFVVGMAGLDDARYAGDWNVSADALSVTAIDTPEWGDTFYDYYQVSFELTNNSQRAVDLDEYAFSIVPEKGDKWAARFDFAADSEAAYTLRPKVPQGCTAPVSMVLRVDPAEVESSTLDLFFEDYAGGIPLGQITLP